jgi:hypothetical protein
LGHGRGERVSANHGHQVYFLNHDSQDFHDYFIPFNHGHQVNQANQGSDIHGPQVNQENQGSDIMRY